ncbi:MAG: ribbon-helix-helix protein, CopG family [Candidatus Limnocylindria bacterium]
MNKTTIYLPDELHRSLQAAARRTGRSQARVVREAVERYLTDADRPQLTSIGMGERRGLDARDYEAWLEDQWSDRDHD